MKLKRDSLLFKTILYNDLSMLLTGMTIIGLVVVFAFKELEKNFSEKAVEKLQVIEGMLELRNNEVLNDLTKFINSDDFFDEVKFDFSKNTEEENKESYKKIKYNLLKTNFNVYPDLKIAIIGKDGMILTEDGLTDNYENKFLRRLKTMSVKLDYSIGSIMYNEKEDIFYYEIIIPMKGNAKIKNILIEIPLRDAYFRDNQYIKIIKHADVIDLGMYKTDIPNKLDKPELDRLHNESSKIIELYGRKYSVKNLSIRGIDFNVISTPIFDYLGRRTGYLVLTMAEPGLSTFKVDTMSLIILATIILILLNSFIINGTFKELLLPLEELSVAVADIASGNLDRTVRLNGTSEIKVLSRATKKMVETLKNSNFILEDQNQKLKDFIHRVEGVEKLLLGVRREPTDERVIDIVLKNFTSSVGLNYDRAIFFEYSEEKGCLVGKKIKKNKHILKEDKLSSFDLRYETMKEIVPLIRIKNDDNLFTKAVREMKIIFENTRGYKTYLGSELLMGFGLNNFMILPIFDRDKNVGCILVDNYISARRIELEDVELFNVILLNLGIHYENNQKEQENISNERDIAIGRMFKKIISRRNQVIEKYTRGMLSQYKDNKIDGKSFREFRDIICNITREDSILFDYSDKKEYNFKKLRINKFLEEVVDSYVKSNENIDISLFLEDTAIFLGDSIELTKALREIINNSLNAIKDVTDGRINIISKVSCDNITIKIKDNGTGIPKKLLGENLFEPFTSGNENSSGLGLTIANKIITSHRGFIRIRSNGDNRGTEVKIILNRYKEDINV